MTGLEDTYRHHHKKRRGEDYVLFGDKRGKFLKTRIGRSRRILDIGCRDGELTRYYAEHNEVLGLDIDEHALQRATDKLGIKIQALDLNGDWVGVPTSYFDVAVAAEVLEHLYNPDIVLKKIVATLSSDGILLGSVPNAFSLANRARLFRGQKAGTPLSDPTHINHFSRPELQSLLEKHFSEVRIYPLGRLAWLDRVYPGMFSFGLLFEARRPRG